MHFCPVGGTLNGRALPFGAFVFLDGGCYLVGRAAVPLFACKKKTAERDRRLKRAVTHTNLLEIIYCGEIVKF